MSFCPILDISDATLLDRATYKKIKAMDKQTMQNFINNIYQTGKNDSGAVAVDMEKIREDIGKISGIGAKRLDEIMEVLDKDLS